SSLTTQNLTNEQEARVALGVINSSLSQASEDTNEGDEASKGTPGTAIFPVEAEAATSIAFYRVFTLAPAAALPTGTVQLEPNPAYKIHIISYDPVGQTVNEYVMDPSAYYAAAPSPAPKVIAQNVTAFSITQPPNTAREYSVSITVNNAGANPNLQEPPYTLVDDVHVMK
ncbi:MAG: hypothetical protein JO293_08020, partial [Candidatus Eremiobacteraeota bacterium]|nr:hypothetical protein [Candidatus Eremiobacteraeota bacterium]